MEKFSTIMSLFTDLSGEGKVFLGVLLAAGVLTTLGSKTESEQK